MRIFDINDNELTSPDLSRGYLKNDKIFIKHHKAIEHVDEQWHYEVVAEYPNGGKEVQKVVDIVGVEAKEAWDEYEDIQRYVEYSEDELWDMDKTQNTPTFEERLQAVEAMLLKLVSKSN